MGGQVNNVPGMVVSKVGRLTITLHLLHVYINQTPANTSIVHQYLLIIYHYSVKQLNTGQCQSILVKSDQYHVNIHVGQVNVCV